MATTVVLLHCSERSQRHFTGHTEEVLFVTIFFIISSLTLIATSLTSF